MSNTKKSISRRRMLVSTPALTALALSGYGINRVNAYSKPSNLKITDMRAITIVSEFNCPIIRIDTNQDIYGLGEVYVNAVEGSALILKPFLIGKDPTDIEGILAPIKRFAGDHIQGGGYSAIDMALHDITGKALDVPAHMLVGTKLRDRVRIYADTDAYKALDPEVYARRLLKRKEMGFTYLKFDLKQNLFGGKPGTSIGGSPTKKGYAIWREYLRVIRDAIGSDIPLGADHFGIRTVNDGIRLGHAVEDFDMAFLEDVLDYRNVEGNKMVTDNITVPTMHGESVFSLEHFKKYFIDPRAVDLLHIDVEVAGGIKESRLIGMEARRNNMGALFHYAGAPVGSIATVHCACTLPNFIAMECHAVDIPWWEDLVTGIPKPMINKGYIEVPDKPGLGIELNEEVVREHLRVNDRVAIPGYFEPSTIYDYNNYGHSGRWAYPHLDEDGNLVNEPIK